MKKLLVLACLFTSTLALAMPIPANVAIQGLMQSEQFNILLSSDVGQFDFVNVEKVDNTYSMVGHCKNLSRSGTVLKVTLGNKKNYNWKSYYFSTSYSERDFSLCN